MLLCFVGASKAVLWPLEQRPQLTNYTKPLEMSQTAAQMREECKALGLDAKGLKS